MIQSTVHQTIRNTYINIVCIDIIRVFYSFNWVKLNSSVFDYEQSHDSNTLHMDKSYNMHFQVI